MLPSLCAQSPLRPIGLRAAAAGTLGATGSAVSTGSNCSHSHPHLITQLLMCKGRLGEKPPEPSAGMQRGNLCRKRRARSMTTGWRARGVAKPRAGPGNVSGHGLSWAPGPFSWWGVSRFRRFRRLGRFRRQAAGQHSPGLSHTRRGPGARDKALPCGHPQHPGSLRLLPWPLP